MYCRLPALLFKLTIAAALLCTSICVCAQSFHAYTEWADQAIKLKQFDEAHYWLQKANSMAPDAKVLYPLLAQTSYKLKQYPECNTWFTESEKSKVKISREGKMQWIECLIRLGRYDDALVKLRETQHQAYNIDYYRAMESWCIFALETAEDQQSEWEVNRYSRQVNTRGNERAAIDLDGSLHFFRESGLFHIANNRARPATTVKQELTFLNRTFELSTISTGFNEDQRFGTFCTPGESFQKQCYIAEWKNGQWELLPAEINKPGFNSVQPFAAITDGDSTLWFASDKPGGYGGYDIWFVKWKNGEWSGPENAGNPVNTSQDDWSPVVNSHGVLYFSSNGHPGYGGFDIYRFHPTHHYRPENLGSKINSAFDEVYFSFSTDTTGYFSSDIPNNPNRYRGTCCYDIFTWSAPEFIPEELIEIPELAVTGDVVVPLDTLTDHAHQTPEEARLEELFTLLQPCTLLFHNNEPTELRIARGQNYLHLKDHLTGLRSQYLNNNHSQYHGQVEEAFDYIHSSIYKLDSLLEALQILIAEDKRFTVNLSGFASPRFRSDYNELLSERRVKSVQRYIELKYPELLKSPHINWISVALGDQTSPSDEGPYTGVYTMQSLFERRVVVLVELEE